MKRKNIFKWSQERGYRIGIGGVELLHKIRDELEKRKLKGEIESNFFREYLSFFRDLKNFKVQNSNSLILVAVPRPAHTIRFEFKGKTVEMILPPTYVGYRGLFESVRKDLEENVFGGQDQVKTLSAPLKALASYLGMISYGRNNIAYIPEFGSYFQLAGYLALTNLPSTELNEKKESVLSRCSNCTACVKTCPLGAIDEDRFLLHAEKCYTGYSESSSPIPSGIHSPSPECIIGCLKCQMVCPVNKGRLNYENTGVIFSSEETHAILDSRLLTSELHEAIESKLLPLGLTEGSDIFFRNFRIFMSTEKDQKETSNATKER